MEAGTAERAHGPANRKRRRREPGNEASFGTSVSIPGDTPPARSLFLIIPKQVCQTGMGVHIYEAKEDIFLCSTSLGLGN